VSKEIKNSFLMSFRRFKLFVVLVAWREASSELASGGFCSGQGLIHLF
jgi:hypothetical protein